MYNIVPPAMLKRVLFFHKCKIVINKRDIISGKPWLPEIKETFLKQYTTRNPIMALGSTTDKYCKNSGVFLFGGNTINGRKRVAIVPKTTHIIVIIFS